MKKIVLVSTLWLWIFYLPVMGQITISTSEELATIGKDNNSLEQSYILMNDIIVDNWKPIGDDLKKNHFQGTLDGNGYAITIQGIDTLPTGSSYVAGLFSSIGKKGVVKNLRVAGALFYRGTDRDNCLGGIAGWNYGTILNCVSTADVTVIGVKTDGSFRSGAVASLLGIQGGNGAGGIAGINEGVIKNCYATGKIESLGEIGLKLAGGIAGGSSRYGIFNCYATGDVIASGDESNRYAGGIVGLNGGNIDHCVGLNENIQVEGKSKKPVLLSGSIQVINSYAGGSIGANTGGKVTNTFWREDVNVTKTKMRMGSYGKKVAYNETCVKSWWEGTPKKFNYAFGTTEDAPWMWDDSAKRPILYWE